MDHWKSYWFKPAPYLDLAIVRIVSVGVQLWILTVGFGFNFGYFDTLMTIADHSGDLWNPLIVVNVLGFLGSMEWGYRPTPDLLALIYYATLAFGCLALVGLITNFSLFLFAVANIYLQGNIYSYHDFHHPEAIMMIALCVLAISPSGKVLSLDSHLFGQHNNWQSMKLIDKYGEFCGWPIKLLQWFFVLMYLSAVWMKLSKNGLDWPNGFTLQFYMAQDGLKGDRPLALWLSHWHWLLFLGQWVVLVFQATFSLAVMFPRLRFIYVPLGLFFHCANWITLGAPFPQWIALYVVFIPWRRLFRSVTARDGRCSGRLNAEFSNSESGAD
jgi:hypothetical protein